MSDHPVDHVPGDNKKRVWKGEGAGIVYLVRNFNLNCHVSPPSGFHGVVAESVNPTID
ncbi:MAG TPA: hypothetical protein VFL79_19655 [Terriglobia bacterium]|nr:hypothetical protein [Terriglobia bacterium]